MPPSTSRPEKSAEDLLFDAMDRQALRFIEMMDNTGTNDDGFDVVSIDLKLKLFDKGQAWLEKRKKLRPEVEEVEGRGIKEMREWISDPNRKDELRQFLFDAGAVLVPDRKNGRPTKAAAEVRSRFKEHKDSGKTIQEPGSGWTDLLNDAEEKH